MANANILFDHDTFDNIDACDGCYEGRLSVRGSATRADRRDDHQHPLRQRRRHRRRPDVGEPTASRSPGQRVPQIKQGATPPTSTRSSSTAPAHTQIVGQLLPRQRHGHHGARRRHERGHRQQRDDRRRLRPAGPVRQPRRHAVRRTTRSRTSTSTPTARPGATPSSNVVLRDNVARLSGAPTRRQRLLGLHRVLQPVRVRGNASGTSAVIGTPAFAGGGSPTTYAGYALAAGSPGKGNAVRRHRPRHQLQRRPAAARRRAPAAGHAGGGTGTGTGDRDPARRPARAAPARAAPRRPGLRPRRRANQARGARVRWTFRPAQAARRRGAHPAHRAEDQGRRSASACGRSPRASPAAAARSPSSTSKAGTKHIAVRITDRSGAIVRGTRDIRVVAQGARPLSGAIRGSGRLPRLVRGGAATGRRRASPVPSARS